MDIILIPGLWLDGSSWDEVGPVLEQAGHRTHPLTLPGMEAKDADSSEVTLRDHVDEFSSAMLRQWMEQGHPGARELATLRDVEYVDLHSGHWPQFSRPEELGRAILASVDPA